MPSSKSNAVPANSSNNVRTVQSFVRTGHIFTYNAKILQLPAQYGAGRYQLNSSGGAFSLYMPRPWMLGAPLTICDTGGFCATNPVLLIDADGNNIQTPWGPGGVMQFGDGVNLSSLSFDQAGGYVTLAMTHDPTNGNFWAVIGAS